MYKIERYERDLEISTFIKEYFQPEMCLQRCKECSGYKKTWTCPEFAFSPVEYWNQFTSFQVIVEQVPLNGVKTPEEAEERLHKEKLRFNKEIRRLEEQTSDGRALYAQECEACLLCARIDDQPCRFPELMRYSVEALGGNAVKLVKAMFGFDILWATDSVVPAYYVLVGGILQ